MLGQPSGKTIKIRLDTKIAFGTGLQISLLDFSTSIYNGASQICHSVMVHNHNSSDSSNSGQTWRGQETFRIVRSLPKSWSDECSKTCTRTVRRSIDSNLRWHQRIHADHAVIRIWQTLAAHATRLPAKYRNKAFTQVHIIMSAAGLR